jgi:hypothetical protein
VGKPRRLMDAKLTGAISSMKLAHVGVCQEWLGLELCAQCGFRFTGHPELPLQFT